MRVDIPGSIAALQAAARQFELRTKIYRFLFQTKGFEFDGYRTYTFEDDAGAIDWKASRRAVELLVRQYREERDRKIIFIIDVSNSMVFGSTEKLKCEYVTELAAALAHLIISYKDQIGYILFNDEVVQYDVPRTGLQVFYRLIEALQRPSIYRGDSRLDKALEFLFNYFSEKITAVFLISDFLHVTSREQTFLGYSQKRYETIALMVKDPRDLFLPDVSSEVVVEDPRGNTQVVVNPRLAREHYESLAREQEKSVIHLLNSIGIDFLKLSTADPFAFPLSRFLRDRVQGGA